MAESVSITFMMMSSNGNIFRVTGPLCGEFTGLGEFPTQRPVTRSFDIFFDLRLNKRLNKQAWGWLFETPSWSSWRPCNDDVTNMLTLVMVQRASTPFNITFVARFHASALTIRCIKWRYVFADQKTVKCFHLTLVLKCTFNTVTHHDILIKGTLDPHSFHFRRWMG